MGLTLSGRYISLVLAVQIAYLLQTVGAVGKCDTVFKGFSNCLLQLGESMSSYPPDMGEKENLQTICTYWDDFHSCATTALADCQEGATELWEKLKKESRNLQFKGSLFELCGGVNDASTPSALHPGSPCCLAPSPPCSHGSSSSKPTPNPEDLHKDIFSSHDEKKNTLGKP